MGENESRNALLEAENQLLRLEIERLKLSELLVTEQQQQNERRRMWRTIGAVAAVVTVALLGWQNIEMRIQNKVILDDSTRARRAQLIATIYDEEECRGEECQPKAHIRSRAEAAMALMELDRGLGRTLSLANAKLRKANLERANMEGAILEYVNLQGSKLGEANLKAAKLWEADLRGARLGEANLEGANLNKANMEEASLGYANLQGSRLLHANLRRAKLTGANLQRAWLRMANLQEADLMYANLRGASLLWADLRGASLRALNLWGESLTKEQLAEAIIDEHTKLPYDLKEYREEFLESSKRNLEELKRHLKRERQLRSLHSIPDSDPSTNSTSSDQ